MSNEKFCLRWNDFENNISNAFKELRDDKDFFDVTLACDDEQIQAHKVILAACSPFFRNILRRNHHQHPLLYMKGVKFTDLQAVLNFMYQGEVNVAQEELNSFLAVAEDLRVKGLTQNQPVDQDTKKDNQTQKKSPIKNPVNHPPPPDRHYHLPPTSVKHPPPHQQRSVPQTNVAASRHNIDDDDIQEVVPVKSEPRDVSIPEVDHQLSSQNMPPPASQSMFTPTQSQSNILAQVDDQELAYPDDNYDDFGHYVDEQEYQGGLNAQPVPTGIEGTEGDMLLFFATPQPQHKQRSRLGLRKKTHLLRTKK